MKKAKGLKCVSIGLWIAIAFGVLLAGVPCSAQTQAQSSSTPLTSIATLRGPESADGHSTSPPGNPTMPTTPDPAIPPAIAQQLAAMQAEIDALKAALMGRDAKAAGVPSPAPATPAATVELKAVEPSATAAPRAAQAPVDTAEKTEPAE